MNNELIKIETNENGTQNEITITSLEIAELTEKRHDHVIRDIEEQLSNLALPKSGFNSTKTIDKYRHFYKTENGRNAKMYRLPRREALIVVSGYNVQLRAKIIDRLEELERKVRGEFIAPKTRLEALQLAVEQEKQIMALENKLTEQAPKVAFANAYTASDKCMLVRDFAKYLTQNNIEIGEKRLFQWLRGNGYLCQNNAPTQKAMELDLFNMSAGTYTNSKGDTINTHTTKLTPKGQVYFLKKFKEMPRLLIH